MKKNNDNTTEQEWDLIVKHEITFWGTRDNVAAVLETLKGRTEEQGAEHPAIDFGKLIYMPEDMDYFEYLHPGTTIEWMAKNWGSESNALDIEIGEWDGRKTTVFFQTKENLPREVIKELIGLCNEHAVVCTGYFAANDLGMLAGFINMDGPICVDDETVLAHEIANDLWKEGK